ncbi:collagen-flanked surface repeat-containing protein [Aerococcus mictus]
MVGKNNFKLLREKNSNRYYRYSIKRLNIGVASVAVAVGLLFMGDASVVRAAADEAHTEEASLPADSAHTLTADSSAILGNAAKSENVEKVESNAPADSVSDKAETEVVPAEVAPAAEETPAEEAPAKAEEVTEAPAAEDKAQSPAEADQAKENKEEKAADTVSPEVGELSDKDKKETPQNQAGNYAAAEGVEIPGASAEAARDAGLDRLAKRILGAANPQEALRTELKDIYTDEEIDGIVKNVDLSKVSNGRQLMEEVSKAGVQYAGDKRRTGFAFYAVPETPTEVRVGGAPVALGNANTPITHKADGIVSGTGNVDNAHYTLKAVPNRAANKVDFELTYRLDPKVNAQLGGSVQHQPRFGIELGSGFNYNPTTGVTAQASIPGNKTRHPQNVQLKTGAATGYSGLSMGSDYALSNHDVKNGYPLVYKFSVPVKDWNGKLDYKTTIGMFNQAMGSSGGAVDPASRRNYFYNTAIQQGDLNPEANFGTREKVTKSPIKFQTKYRTTTELPIGAAKQVKAGEEGVTKHIKTVRTYKGVDLGEIGTRDEIEKPAVDAEILLGVGLPEGQKLPVEPPVVNPRLSGDTTISGTAEPNKNITVTVGGKTYQTRTNPQGEFQVSNVPALNEGDTISAVVHDGDRTSRPGKTIVPRDGRTPKIVTERGNKDGRPGTKVIVTDPATGNVLNETFVYDGQQGPKGEQGAKGEKGDPGAKGDKGETGARGPQGQRGPQGATGAQGQKGEKGDPGVAGPQGAKGDKGEDGKSFVPVVDRDEAKKETTIKFYPAKADGTADTTKNPVATGVVKDGAKGETGATGATGAQGAKGEDGKSFVPVVSRDEAKKETTIKFYPAKTDGSADTSKEPVAKGTVKDGEKGERGEVGPQGPQGIAGPKGDKGETGATGAQGPKGDKGEAGAQGPQGPKGDTGAQGPKGDQGEKGEQGTPGKDGRDGLSPLVDVRRNDANDGVIITITPRHYNAQGQPENGTPTTSEVKDGAPGTDGKTYVPVVEKGTDGITHIKFYPAKKDGTPDKDQQPIATGQVKDGEKGDPGIQGPQGEKGDTGATGAQGEKGKDGVDGKSYVPVVERDEAGKQTAIKFYPAKADGTADKEQKPVAEGIVKDGEKGETGATGAQGEKGKDGADGKSYVPVVERDEPNKQTTIKFYPAKADGTADKAQNPIATGVVKDGKDGAKGDKGETGATGATGAQGAQGEKGHDGADGKTFVPVVEKGENGVTTIKFYPATPTGEADKNQKPVATGEVNDGKDGKSPLIETTRVDDADPKENGNQPGTKVTIKDPVTKEVLSESFVKDGVKGDKGEKGDPGKNGRDGLTPLVDVKRNPANDGVIITLTPRSYNEQGEVVTGDPVTSEVKDGAKGYPGKDGKSPLVETTRVDDADPNTDGNQPGAKVTFKDPTTGATLSESFVKDGEKGEKGDKGNDGLTYAPVVEKGKDGVTTIKFYPVDPQTGQPDKSKQPFAEGQVKDGAKGEKGDPGQAGKNGVDGKTFVPVVEKGDNGITTIKFYPAGKDGQADKSQDPVATGEVKDGKNGKDGLTPKVETRRNDTNDGVIIKVTPQVRDAQGNVVDGTPTETEVKDGKNGENGKTYVPVVEKGDNGVTTIKFYPANAEGKADTTKDPVATGQVKDGAKGDKGEQGIQGEKGQDGKNGTDGKTFVPVVEKGKDGVTTIKFYPANAEGQADKTKDPVATGEVKDGKTPIVETSRVEDADPSIEGKQPGTKIVVKDPETKDVISKSFVKDGIDGQTFAPVVTKGADGKTTIKFYPVNPETKQPDTTKDPVATGEVKDGKDGLTPKVETRRNDTNDGVIIKVTPQVRDAQGNVVDGTPSETEVKDGKTYAPVITKGQDGVSTIKFYPVDPKTGQADQTKNPVASGEIKDGAKGDKGEKGDPGEKGQDGKNGENGKTFAPVVTKGADGTTSIKFYPVNPETGKADESQPAVAEGTVKDGQDGKTFVPVVEKGDNGVTTIKFYPTGKDGQADKSKDPVASGEVKDGADGKTFVPVVEKGDNGVTTIKFYPAGKDGQADKTKDPVATGEVKDGKSPVVETTRVEDADPAIEGNQPGTKVTVKDPETGNVISESFVKDGEKGEKGDKGTDGKTPVVETTRVEDADPTTEGNQPGTKVTVKDPETNKVISESFVKDGNDGQSYAPVVKKGEDGTTTIKFYPVDPKTGKADESKPAVAEGTVKDGVNGKSAYTTVVEGPNAAGEPGQWIINYFDKNGDGKFTDDEIVSTQFVRNGKDGKDGKDGKTYAPVLEKGADGTTSIKFYPVNPETGKADQTQPSVAEGTVKDGQDGKTFAPVLEKGKDGETTIKFYPVDPKTGKADESQPAVAEGTVKDGKDGKAPVVETERVEDLDPNTPGKQAGTKITVKDPETGKVISETFVKDGQDGKSPEVTTKDNGNGTHTITIKNPDGTTTTTTVKDGAKGDKGEKGQDGTNGVDGKTYAPVVERGQDGTTIIKFYPVDPKTGKVDKSQEPVATGEVKDGAQGAAGQDGKSSYTTVVTGPNDAGEQGQWIINYYDKNGDGKFTDDEMVSAKFVRDGKDGKSPEVTTKDNCNGTHTITIKNPDGTTTTTTVKDGKDGKAPVVETSRVEDADPNTPDNQPGTKITVKDPDTGKVINETFVKDGKDGKDGQSYAPVVEKGQDGTTTIKFYPVDPKTGKADTTQPAVAEGTVKDGANGKSAYTTVVEGPNAAGEPGRWIINYFDKNNDGKFTDDEVVSAQFVRDGKDGQSPTVEVKDNGDGTHTITTKNPDGSVNSTTTVKNGKDGKSPVVESTRVEDADPNTPGNQAGTKITVKDPETGKVISETFVKDGVNGKDGKDGKNGIDGKSFAPVVEKGQDGTTTIKFYPVDPKTGKPDTTQAPVAEGSVKDGKDGKSPEVTTKDNGDGTHTITIKNPDGTTTTTTVKDGKDGKTPEVGVKDNGDGSHTITIKNPDGTTTTTTVRDGKNGQNGKDGIDGKTFAPVVEKGQDGTTTIKFYPVDPKTGKPDTTQPAVAEGSVKDGKDGKSPEVTTTDNGDGTHTITIKNPDGTTTTTTVKDGKDGRDGIDGKTFAPVVEKGQDGTTTIKFYPVDPKTGKPDTSQPAVAEGSVKDGRDGKDGKDGRSERIRTEKGKDSQGNEGVWVIITDDKGNELSREFIRDGKTPSVKVEEGKNSRGESGQWIIVFDGDGNEVSREFVRDGKDGASSSLETVPGKNEKGESGLWVIVKDGQGNESSRHFVRDGKDGKDGKDGRSVQKIYNREGKLIIIFSDHTTEEIEIPCCKSCPESPRTPKPGDPTPDVPGQPEKPDQPDQPEVPEPGEPEEPGQPDQPEVPVPGQPDQPEVPEPSEPEEPGQPNQPEKPVPGDPTPEVPTVPADPEKPGQPDQPKVPVPGNPTSEVPNVPAEPRPEVPNQPSDPAPQVPGQADPDNSFKTKDNKSVTNKEQDDQNKQASLPATGAEVTSAMTVIIASLLLSSGALLVKNNKKD